MSGGGIAERRGDHLAIKYATKPNMATPGHFHFDSGNLHDRDEFTGGMISTKLIRLFNLAAIDFEAPKADTHRRFWLLHFCWSDAEDDLCGGGVPVRFLASELKGLGSADEATLRGHKRVHCPKKAAERGLFYRSLGPLSA
jgi:hypothetical protein